MGNRHQNKAHVQDASYPFLIQEKYRQDMTGITLKCKGSKEKNISYEYTKFDFD